MVVCALIPRFHLLVAAGGAAAQLGRPLALAPDPSSGSAGSQAIGETSGAAEAFGVRAGMRLAEALSRCPELVLLPPDPGRAERAWERVIARLEGIGAAVESQRPGEAYFESRGLHDLHGGVEGVMSRGRRALGRIPTLRLGSGPSRLCAFAAAAQRRPRRSRGRHSRGTGHLDGGSGIVPEGAARAFLAPLPVRILRGRSPLGRIPEGALARERERGSERMLSTLERLGIRTLGELTALPRDAVADRFGAFGLEAWRLAQGEDEPLRPRAPQEQIRELIELPEAASGQHLERALELLVDRLLANKARRGRSIRRVRLEARLAAGGGWQADAVMRSTSSSSERLLLALAPKLAQLPAPARELGLHAVVLGPAGGEQLTLPTDPADERQARLGEAVRQTRAACGRDALLRVLEVDPESHVPERRAILTPFHER